MMMRESITTKLSAFSEKQNPYQNAYTYFCHVILIISHEKFQFQNQLESENFNCLLSTLSFQNPYFYFILFKAQKPTTTLFFIQDTRGRRLPTYMVLEVCASLYALNEFRLALLDVSFDKVQLLFILVFVILMLGTNRLAWQILM